MSATRPREEDDAENNAPSPKRAKVDEETTQDVAMTEASVPTNIEETQEELESILPPSHALLGLPVPTLDGETLRIMETDVGISEYVGNDLPKIEGIIKQRYEPRYYILPYLNHFSDLQTSWFMRWIWTRTSYTSSPWISPNLRLKRKTL